MIGQYYSVLLNTIVTLAVWCAEGTPTDLTLGQSGWESSVTRLCNCGKKVLLVHGQAFWSCLGHIPLLKKWDGLQLLIGSCWMGGNDCSTIW